MRTGVSYMGHHNPQHITTNIKGICLAFVAARFNSRREW